MAAAANIVIIHFSLAYRNKSIQKANDIQKAECGFMSWLLFTSLHVSIKNILKSGSNHIKLSY